MTSRFALPHQLLDFLVVNISETAIANNYKIYHHIALGSLYISTGNDITVYFRAAVNRINVFILGHIGVAISRYWFNRFRKVYDFGKEVPFKCCFFVM